jgi:hypothetical protein
MAVTATVEDNFNFVGGLNTEGGFFVTPKNSWVEGTNTIPETDGSARIREAIELENGYSTLSFTNGAVSNYAPASSINNVFNTAYVVHKWENINGNPNVSLFVVQIGSNIYFYDSSKAITSDYRKAFDVDLLDYKIAQVTQLDPTAAIQVVSFYGNLLVTHKHIDPLILVYNDTNDTLDVFEIKLRIRDFKGIFTNYSDNVEKTDAEWVALGLKEAVVYNLLNQGWNGSQLNTYKSSTDRWPSNAKQWIFGKDSNDDFAVATLNKQEFGSSPAPRGRNILEAFDQARSYPNDYFGDLSVVAPPVPASTESRFYTDENGFLRSEVVEIPGYTPDPTKLVENGEFLRESYASRPSCCTFFGGRAFYAGATSNVVNSWVLYSQITENYTKIGECYQKNDPTAEVVSDLVDDDGGLIVIQNSGQIHAIKSVGNAVLVFAANGIWSIYGGDAGFKATSYIVDKVTDVGCISPLSVIAVENSAFYWSDEGIYSVTVDSTGLSKAENISNTKVKTLYNDIPYLSKLRCHGLYDNVNKIVYWMYGTNLDKPAYKDTILAANLQMGAFYTLSFPQTAGIRLPAIVGFNFTEPLVALEINDEIVIGTDPVVIGTDPVIITAQIADNNLPILKFFTTYTDYFITGVPPIINNERVNFTFADLQKTSQLAEISFQDFSGYIPGDALFFAPIFEPNAVTYPRKYFITAYSLGNNGPARAKTVQYLSVFCKRTETALDVLGQEVNPSSCLLQTRWDFTDNTNTGKWSDEQQLYRYNRVFLNNVSQTLSTGYPLVITKNKIRGRGKALQMKFEAETGKNMHIYGWSMNFTGNTNV